MWTGVAGGGGLPGVFLSAVLVDVAGWRYLFALPVALVLVALAAVWRTVPDSREVARHAFDVVGSLVSVVAVIGLIFALHEGPEHGWPAPCTVFGLLVGVLGAAGSVVWELGHPAPLLDVRLFRELGLADGSVVLLVVFGVQAGVSVVLYPFFRSVFGWPGLLATVAITSALPRQRHGVASALNDVTREFGTALGVALLSWVHRPRRRPQNPSR
ncbi:putative MFS family arabinose efflux permease [Crossiella equi]|uniref:MFS family arabinose efflux permease n=1 Tax=Crossiella equi TaxID=130796 RepID=A0ABS5AQU8_9PSEU|nr:hypothetical protein [Crossiella equi]MBP2478938.1 putative MFS family arabinose efflux permease [Crossiella equi]